MKLLILPSPTSGDALDDLVTQAHRAAGWAVAKGCGGGWYSDPHLTILLTGDEVVHDLPFKVLAGVTASKVRATIAEARPTGGLISVVVATVDTVPEGLQRTRMRDIVNGLLESHRKDGLRVRFFSAEKAKVIPLDQYQMVHDGKMLASD